MWGIVVLVVPPLLAYFRNSHSEIDWLLIKNTLVLYAGAATLYLLAYLTITPRRLDEDREQRERQLTAAIQQGNETIRALSEKPKRSAADQDYYDTGKKVLLSFGVKTPIAVKALRHLLKHEPLTYHGPGSSFLNLIPDGMNIQDTFWAYNACAGSLVKIDEKYGSGERTYSIPASMRTVLAELLYDQSVLG